MGLDLTDLPTAERGCKFCGGRFIFNGYTIKGTRRLICTQCGKSSCWLNDCGPFTSFRIGYARCVHVTQCLAEGLSLRQTAYVARVAKETVSRIIRTTGFVRRCRKCNSPIPHGNRFWFCSDFCQDWRTKIYRPANKTVVPQIPLYDASANVLNLLQSSHGHERLALEFAITISDRNAAEYLGPCYEAIREGCAIGISDIEELRSLAVRKVKVMWKETRSFLSSLDAIKEANEWEPTYE